MDSPFKYFLRSQIMSYVCVSDYPVFYWCIFPNARPQNPNQYDVGRHNEDSLDRDISGYVPKI